MIYSVRMVVASNSTIAVASWKLIKNVTNREIVNSSRVSVILTIAQTLASSSWFLFTGVPRSGWGVPRSSRIFVCVVRSLLITGRCVPRFFIGCAAGAALLRCTFSSHEARVHLFVDAQLIVDEAFRRNIFHSFAEFNCFRFG